MPIPIAAVSGGASPVPSARPSPEGPPAAVTLAPDTASVESGYAWFRLLVAMLMSTIGGVGMWSVIVAIPTLQAEFAVDRSGASLPCILTMVGFRNG